MKKINQAKKMFAVSVVAALLASVSPIKAFAARAPKDPDGRGTIDIQYIGAKACRIVGTTTAAVCSNAGSTGLLYALCSFGTATTAGSGAMAFDTAGITGASSFDTALSYVQSYAISPVVFGTGSMTANSWQTCFQPPVPVRYEAGLVLKLNSTSVGAVALVRPDTGINP